MNTTHFASHISTLFLQWAGAVAVGVALASLAGCSGETPAERAEKLPGSTWHGSGNSLEVWMAFGEGGEIGNITYAIAEGDDVRTGYVHALEGTLRDGPIPLSFDVGNATVEGSERIVANIALTPGQGRQVILTPADAGAYKQWREAHAEPVDYSAEHARQKLPEDFPADLPVDPDATLAGGPMALMMWGGEDASLSIIEVESRALFDLVRDYYREELPKAGWEVVKFEESPGGVHIRAEKDDRRADFGIYRKKPLPYTTINLSPQDAPPISFNFGDNSVDGDTDETGL